MLLGVDVGGTFTDAVLAGPDGLLTAKLPTTPADQSIGVMAAVRAVLEAAGVAASAVDAFAHGMTVATNALLEGRSARTAFVTTEGFTDLIALGRQARKDLYRLDSAHPPPLSPPERRFGAPERTGPESVLRELTAGGAAAVAEAVAGCSPEAVAVCLLHSWRDPTHERQLGAALRRRLGDGPQISLSHEVVGTFREFERAATTEIDAALSPLLREYLDRLLNSARAAGLPSPTVMQSSGGLIPAAAAARNAALTVLSGPAGGSAAATLLAARCGEPDLLCFDMGGTSCDVSVIQDGRASETHDCTVGGRPLALGMIDIHTVGAGGGSIAWRDAGGALRVGPQSAGALPGPAAYGRGGAAPTVTDAHVVLGRLRPDVPLAGIALDAAAATTAVARLAHELGLDTARCARGIVAVANAEMIRALRVMTVERGIDPRSFALLAFGGAGPLHAAEIAEALEISRILIPRASGVLSALGLAAAERRVTRQRTVMLRGASVSDAQLVGPAAALLDQVAAELPGADGSARLELDVRYAGQAHELTIASATRPCVASVRRAFETLHEQRYGWHEPETPIEIVTIRATATLPPAHVDLGFGAQTPASVRGPQTLRLDETTIHVPAGWQGETDATGTLMLRRTP